MEEEKYTRPKESTSNHTPDYQSSESTVGDKKVNYGNQDTYGEPEANQVSVQGLF